MSPITAALSSVRNFHGPLDTKVCKLKAVVPNSASVYLLFAWICPFCAVFSQQLHY